MDPLLAGVAGSALTEGVKFLYQQAGEILSSWRARRRDASALPPRTLPAPQDVTVGEAEPLSDPPTDETLATLQELKDLAEPIKDGVVDIDNPAAREAIAELRELVEAILQTQITFAGEAPRPARIANVEVVTKDVAGRVTGVRAKLAEVEHVRVKTGEVKPGGEVTGVEQT
jgi:hypothetical protein